VQGDARMTVGFQHHAAVGTFNRLGINGLVTTRAFRH
jgi:hypothetical protein